MTFIPTRNTDYIKIAAVLIVACDVNSPALNPYLNEAKREKNCIT